VIKLEICGKNEMIKLVGKIDRGRIPELDTTVFNGGDRDVLNDDVAVDACVSRFAKFFAKQAEAEGDLSPMLSELIRSTREALVDCSFERTHTCSEERDSGSILVFRNVSQHNDLGFYLYKRNSMMKPRDRIRAATFSIVLKGQCTLNLHRKSHVESLKLSPGDVYVFNQDIVHSVSDASEVCVHLTISVPLNVARTLPSLTLDSVRKTMIKSEIEEFELEEV
jgi:hypothetical protein